RHLGDGAGAPRRRGRDSAASRSRRLSARCRGRGLPRRAGRARGWTRSARRQDRKSTRLNSSHLVISYAVFCLKKKKKKTKNTKKKFQHPNNLRKSQQTLNKR